MGILRTGTGTIVESASATSIVPPFPTGASDGDYVVFVATVPCTSTATETTEPTQTITNWTRIAAPKFVNDTNAVCAFGRFKDASWSTMPTVSTSHAASRTAAASASYSGVDTTTPLDGVTAVFSGTTTAGAGGTSLVMTGVSPSAAGAMLLNFCIVDSSTDTFSPAVPSGMTSIATSTGTADGTAGRGLTFAEELRASSGPTGTRTWTHGASVGHGGYMFVLRASTIPAAAGTAAAVSGATGAITARMVASSTAPAVSGATGAITSILQVSGTAVATSGATGNIIRTPPPVAGTAAAVSGATGDVIVKVGLVGTAAAVSGATGTLGPFRLALNGTAAAVSTASGTLTMRALASGTAVAVSGATGTLGPFRLALAGTAVATSTASGTLRGIYQVSGQANAVSGALGSLLVTGKPGQGNEVLVLFDENEVLTGGRVTYYQFDLLDEDENLIGQLRGVAGGEVSVDAYAAVKSTGKLTVYTDPDFAHVRDNQPDFLGVQINVPLGPTATATATTTLPADNFKCADADSVDISVGDRVIVTDSAGQPKDSAAYTVRLKTSSAGTTTIWLTTSTTFAVAVGDILKTVDVTFEQRVDWLNVRIRPMIRIQRLGGGDDPEGKLTPAGVFLCAAPVERYTAVGLVRDVELADKLSILDQDIATGDPAGVAAYALDTGANVIDAVKALIAETGETSPAIEPDSKVLSAPMVWEVGATRLKVINDLLDAAGYFSLYCDGQGQYQAKPYVSPASRVPVYESIAPFSNGAQSLMDPDWTRDRNIYSIPNRYVLVGQGTGTTPALVSVATNVDPDSPYSQPNRGRWITAVEVGIEAVDQASLDLQAQSRLSRATSVTNQLALKHAFLPDLHVNNVVKFVNPEAGLDTYCYVVTTTIPFDPTALCSTTMRLVT
jgi:hypothetical protein